MMNTFVEGIEFELILKEWALFCRSGREVQMKECGEQWRDMYALILRIE